MKNLNIESIKELSENELKYTNGGFSLLPVIGGAIIWGLWEIFDSPEDFKAGLKAGLK